MTQLFQFKFHSATTDCLWNVIDVGSLSSVPFRSRGKLSTDWATRLLLHCRLASLPNNGCITLYSRTTREAVLTSTVSCCRCCPPAPDCIAMKTTASVLIKLYSSRWYEWVLWGNNCFRCLRGGEPSLIEGISHRNCTRMLKVPTNTWQIGESRRVIERERKFSLTTMQLKALAW